jgi:hypothetical protein
MGSGSVVGVDAGWRANDPTRFLTSTTACDSQPNLQALRNLALALSVSTDALVFDPEERGPGDDLRLQFEATSRLDDEGKNLVKALLEAVLLRQEARRWTNVAS